MGNARCDGGNMDQSKGSHSKQWIPAPPDKSSIYFGPTHLSDDPGPEIDFSMDAFDRQLLAGRLSLSDWQRDQSQQRCSLPSYTKRTAVIDEGRRILKDDLQGVRPRLDPSSSPSLPVSSPIVSALQNRSQTLQRPRQSTFDVRLDDSSMVSDDSFRARATHKISARPQELSLSLPQAPPIVRGIPLVPTDRLPDHLRSLFKFELFNAIQSKCFTTAFETNDNVVLSAPTGSGKTVIMELALCRLLASNQNQDFKVIYQAPTKSLCNERYRDWTSRFSTFGLKCAELTGDIEYAHLKAVQSAHIIVTTPEKWDSVTRKWRDNARLMQMIKLFLVDEVHILNESRGATLEAVVSRMKSVGSGVRFVALSATIPNSDDIAAWLGRSSTVQHLPAHREVFDETFRPVKLEKHVVGYNCKPNDFVLDSILTKEIPAVIARHAKRKPVMVFCMTKNSAARTASSLAELWFATVDHLRLWNAPKRSISVEAQELRKLLPAGVAFHHSALSADDRRAIETGFLHGDISVICSTSTLAVGINLPCYLVILKGTSCWSDNGLQEYSSLDVMQMLGRAGRPQYETSACAVVLTHNEKVQRYEEMVSSQEILESCLHKNLVEHLNAEIGIGTIHDIETAKKWLTSSFLSVRLRQNPGYYHLQGDTTTTNADELLEQICERDVKLLADAQLISNSNGLRCTEYGDAMARYYIQFKTMLTFLQLLAKPKISEILSNLVQAQEFYDMRLRAGEKAMYKQINKENDIRYPIKVDLALPAHKTSLLIQAHLGGVDPSRSNGKYTVQFKQDMLSVMNHCNRLIRCIVDVQISRKDAVGVKNALELCRSISAGVWDNTPMQLKQIESVGDVTARKLAAAGIKSIDTLLSTEPHRIEVVLGKSQPFGSMLLKKAAKCPNLRVSVKEIDRSRKDKPSRVELRLNSEVGYLNETLPTFFNRKGVYICFLCETSDGKLIDFRRFSAGRLTNGEQVTFTASLETRCSTIKTHVMCDEIAGTHRYAELELNIPDAWLLDVVLLQTPTEPTNGSVVSKRYHTDNFDDCGLEDEDFLAIDPNVRSVGIIEEDNDNLVLQHETGAKGGLKRKAISTNDEHSRTAAVKQYHQPTQLANGNWTCQHSCNADGKECKHQCCKEGVKRPKKRAKIQGQVTATSANSSIKNAFSKPSTDSSPRSAVRILDIDEILCKTAKQLRNNGASATDISTPDENTGPNNTKLRTSNTDHVIDFYDLVSDDLPNVEAILSYSNQKTTNVNSSFGKTAQRQDRSASVDVQPNDIDPEYCDWQIVADSADDLANSSVNFSKWFDSTQSSDGHVRDDAGAQSLCSTVKPSSLLAKDGFLASPEKSDAVSLDQTLHTVHPGAFDDPPGYLDDLDDVDVASFEQTAPGTINEYDITTNIVQTSNVVEIDSPRPTANSSSNKEAATNKETETQRRRRLHEEDQKRRWARLPSWLYEEFGAYVDLV